MKKIISWSLILAAFLASCSNAPTAVPQTQTSEVSETSEVLPIPAKTPTPLPPTATPVPTYSIEQLTAMSSADKLAMAPQVATASAEVVSSFLPQGANATTIVWGEKTLSFWDRVIVYNGQVDSPGGKQDIKLYYDLESGQWAKKYESFESLSQIPADQVPDVMILNDQFGDHLIRNKLQYNYAWISQPQAMTEDGKMIFRDEKGYPKAVFNTVNQKWLTPEEADVVWTWDKWKKIMTLPNGGSTPMKDILNIADGERLTDPNVIMSMWDGNPFLILHPSGIITVGGDRKYIVERLNEGATIFTEIAEPGWVTIAPIGFIWIAAEIAKVAYQNGYRDVRIEIGEIPATIKLRMNAGSFIEIKNIVTITLPDGTIVTPILDMPKHFKVSTTGPDERSLKDAGLSGLDSVNWLDTIIKAGFNAIHLYSQ